MIVIEGFKVLTSLGAFLVDPWNVKKTTVKFTPNPQKFPKKRTFTRFISRYDGGSKTL